MGAQSDLYQSITDRITEEEHETMNACELTEIDSAILWGLAERQAGSRPRWFEPLETGDRRDSAIRGVARRSYRSLHLAQDLFYRLSTADRGAARSAAVADYVAIATIDRLSRADWLPARITEYLEG